MPAYSDDFPWPSYYGHYDFFEQRMRAHNRVHDLEALGDGRYRLTRADGTILEVFVCECYLYAAAQYMATVEAFGRLDAIIISSNWCGYDPKLKLECMDKQVGLFDIGEFMGALNRPDFWAYLTDTQEKILREMKEQGFL